MSEQRGQIVGKHTMVLLVAVSLQDFQLLAGSSQAGGDDEIFFKQLPLVAQVVCLVFVIPR